MNNLSIKSFYLTFLIFAIFYFAVIAIFNGLNLGTLLVSTIGWILFFLIIFAHKMLYDITHPFDTLAKQTSQNAANLDKNKSQSKDVTAETQNKN